jgi:hypothetical protein
MISYVTPTCKGLQKNSLFNFAWAQTGQVIQFLDTQTIDPCGGVSDGLASEVTFNFDVSAITPTAQGTLTVFVFGDIGDASEFFNVTLDGVSLSPTVGANGTDCSSDEEVFALSSFFTLEQFQAAAADGDIEVVVSPEGGAGTEIQCFCADDGANEVTVTLQFPGVSS